MSSNPPFKHLVDAPEGKEFGGFLREESDKRRFVALQSWLDERDLIEEENLLASFTYISGGFSTKVPEALFEHGLTTLRKTVSANDLDVILQGNYSNTHRRRPDQTPSALVTFHRNISPTFTGFIEQIQGSDDPFNNGMSRLTGGVYSFGRLASFDWLEVLVRVHGYDWLAPSSLKEEHLTSSGGPPAGFNEVFGIELGEEYTKECLNTVEQYAKDDLNLPDTKRVFEIESAFCNFQKLDGEERKTLKSKC